MLNLYAPERLKDHLYGGRKRRSLKSMADEMHLAGLLTSDQQRTIYGYYLPKQRGKRDS